jgi:hypothetical protein
LAVEYLHLVDGVELKCEFPRVMESLRKLIDTITSLHAVQTSLSTTVAEKLPLLKEYILMAEDARTLGNMQVMRDMYMVVNELNAEMIGEHAKRSKQHQELVSSLKTLNTFIQRSSVLRGLLSYNAWIII